MSNPNEERDKHYERRVSNAIGEGKSAVKGTLRGIWKSLPNWLQATIEGTFAMAIIFGVMYLVLLVIAQSA